MCPGELIGEIALKVFFFYFLPYLHTFTSLHHFKWLQTEIHTHRFSYVSQIETFLLLAIPKTHTQKNEAFRFELIPGVCSMKRLGVFLLPLDRMLVHCRSFPNNLPVPIYTPGWREALWELSFLPKNTTQCPRPGLEPGPLALGTSALTMRPPRLPTKNKCFVYFFFKLCCRNEPEWWYSACGGTVPWTNPSWC